MSKVWYNENDKKYLEPFLIWIHKEKKEGFKYFRFYYGSEQIIVKYDCEADSDNNLDIEDKEYEEYYEIYFIIEKVEKQSSSGKYKKGRYLCINYHNLPDKWEVIDGDVK